MTSSNWLFFYMKERQSLFSSTYEEQPGEGIGTPWRSFMKK